MPAKSPNRMLAKTAVCLALVAALLRIADKVEAAINPVEETASAPAPTAVTVEDAPDFYDGMPVAIARR
jgi:hypothetical protein